MGVGMLMWVNMFNGNQLWYKNCSEKIIKPTMNRMKSQIFKLSLAILLFFSISAFYSCEKNDENIEGDVAIYLLDEYNKKVESSAILEDGIVLNATPVLDYSEIVSYNPVSYTFEITPAAAERLKGLYQSAFAVTIEGEIVYTAYFWSSISSHIVDWVIADLITLYDSNSFKVGLGYPYLMEGMSIPDNRNDQRLLSIFDRDGKLLD